MQSFERAPNFAKALLAAVIVVSHSISASWGQQQNTSDPNTRAQVDRALDAVIPIRTTNARTISKLIYFITNRVFDESAIDRAHQEHKVLSIESVFKNSLNNFVRYGWVEVSYPANRRRGEYNYSSGSTSQNPLYHFSVVDFLPIDTEERFHGEIARRNSARSGSLLFIHGFENSFPDSAERLAQLAVDLPTSEVPVLFSWPADVGWPLIMPKPTYMKALGMARDSVKFATYAMSLLKEYKPINVIAHSMGTYVVASAISLAHQNRELDDAIPHAIVLAAPDISTDAFDATLRPQLVRPERRVVIYCSSDWALFVSRGFNKSDDRLGYCPETKKGMQGVDVVHVRGQIEDFARHSYYLTAVGMLDDIVRGMNSNSAVDRVRNLQVP